jgi:hypothetical protein
MGVFPRQQATPQAPPRDDHRATPRDEEHSSEDEMGSGHMTDSEQPAKNPELEARTHIANLEAQLAQQKALLLASVASGRQDVDTAAQYAAPAAIGQAGAEAARSERVRKISRPESSARARPLDTRARCESGRVVASLTGRDSERCAINERVCIAPVVSQRPINPETRAKPAVRNQQWESYNTFSKRKIEELVDEICRSRGTTSPTFLRQTIVLFINTGKFKKAGSDGITAAYNTMVESLKELGLDDCEVVNRILLCQLVLNAEARATVDELRGVSRAAAQQSRRASPPSTQFVRASDLPTEDTYDQ